MNAFLPKEKSKSGFITLLSLLIAGAVGLAIAASLITLGIDYSKSTLVTEASVLAKNLAGACADEALEKIREDQNYSGSGGLTLGQGSCTYQVSNLGGQSRQINSTGLVRESVKKMKIIISQIAPRIKIASWQEVGDF